MGYIRLSVVTFLGKLEFCTESEEESKESGINNSV